MSFPTRPNENVVEVESQIKQAHRRMGARLIVEMEKPVRCLTLSGDQPIELPWSEGKPLGTQARDLGGVDRLLDADGQVIAVNLNWRATPDEIRRLNAGMNEAAVIENVNYGVGHGTKEEESERQ